LPEPRPHLPEEAAEPLEDKVGLAVEVALVDHGTGGVDWKLAGDVGGVGSGVDDGDVRVLTDGRWLAGGVDEDGG
jgi:hypothetical protein